MNTLYHAFSRPLSRPFQHLLFALAASVAAIPALAILKTDPAKSSVSAVFKQLNVPVEAKFKRFVAQIDFDPSKIDAAKANLEIDISSFDLGDPEYNKEVLKKDWFNSAQFPKATFTSSSIKVGANGQYNVTGKLSIKGKTSDVQFPLNVKKQANMQVFEGSLPIKRLTYNIGEGEWKDTATVADEVVIKFRVVAAQ
jgi:polyisoprenoid-binding protein YceI